MSQQQRSPWLPLLAVTGFVFSAPAFAQGSRQTDADHYTRYELLAPGTAKFRIIYEVTATTPGARQYFNPIRRGSIATEEAVYDRMTGKALPWRVVNGRIAAAGGVRGADSTGEYIAVDLARPVPKDGEARLLIDKTYEDARSYVAGGDTLVFTRGLGIKKNSVVLPVGYELVSVNYPSQVRQEADGRLQLSFINIGPAEVPYVVKARRTGGVGAPPNSQRSVERASDRNPSIAISSVSAATAPTALAPAQLDPRRDPRMSERARQDREIVYFLQPPETSAFDLYHDYTESRPGIGRYLNVVRGGSRVSNPSAYILDTGEPASVRTLRGAAITTGGVDIGAPVTAESEVVVIDFKAPTAGESVRLRISETYTDPARYRLQDGELVWDRAFGRPANAMVLPQGWALTNCSVPATVSRTDDGRTRLDFLNPRNDDISVLLTARRR
ncbi:MAG: hypothetical protein IPK85_10215 [Gemmatimonadetes bacterium]|nr:hypothetical protein [Gemmatimonadota bacterium]